jgi:Cu/Ag efflux pump CusA
MLCLGTNNQLGRIVDRTRIVSSQLTSLASTDESCPFYQHQLQVLEVRWTLVLRALKLFYTSLGSFAAAALISLVGAVLTSSALHAAFIVIALLGLSSGTVGVAGLVIGCAAMVKETRLAVENLAKETSSANRQAHKEKSPTAAIVGVRTSN